MTSGEPRTGSSKSRAATRRRSLLGLVAVVPAAVVGSAWALTDSAAADDGTSTRTRPVPPELRPGGSFDRYLRQLAERDTFSGTVLVARGTQPVFSRSYGMADKKASVPNAADTIYCLASVTKLFTAIAVGQLVQDGTVTLLDTIGTHLSGFAPEVADRVTIHHLLTHTSGLGDFMQDKGYFDEVTTWTTPEQMMDGTLRYVRTESLAFPPGAGEQYSNSGYHVLGCIIAKVSGMSYYDYVRDHVFRPAGMSDSDFTTLPRWKAGRRYAHPYPTDGSGSRADALDGNDFAYIGNPAGNAFATAPDLIRFARALLGGTLLNATYREVFLCPKAPLTPLPAKPGLPAITPFGSYAPMVSLINGRWVTGHNGGAPGISTNLDWYPGTDWVAVKLSNYDTPETAAIDQELHTILTS